MEEIIFGELFDWIGEKGFDLRKITSLPSSLN